jgi:ornithine decarboxylase
MDAEVEKIYRDNSSIEKIIDEKIASNTQERSFYVVDMYDIYKKHMRWLNLMPRVKPFYAIKCNNLPEIVAFLASLGTGFDCASKQEIDQVLSYGVDPTNIIYANPCKTKFFIKHAKNVNVNLMTFDNELELRKVAQLHPDAKLVLRIKGNDRTSRCKFNIKFGADLDICYDLLKVAKQLDLNVVGVSFHNGSDCAEADAYYQSIAAARDVIDLGREIGHDMTLLDIGGGFPGDDKAKVSFEELAASINAALDTFFPIGCGVDIIAEPGRYYVASAMTLATMVIAKRVEYDARLGHEGYMYYLNDGVYGAFNNVLFEHATPVPQLLDERTRSKRKLRSTVMWGPTCDSVDCIKRDFSFPELQIGEWLIFKNMGAYTCCVATSFNGFEKATIIIADRPFECTALET